MPVVFFSPKSSQYVLLPKEWQTYFLFPSIPFFESFLSPVELTFIAEEVTLAT